MRLPLRILIPLCFLAVAAFLTGCAKNFKAEWAYTPTFLQDLSMRVPGGWQPDLRGYDVDVVDTLSKDFVSSVDVLRVRLYSKELEELAKSPPEQVPAALQTMYFRQFDKYYSTAKKFNLLRSGAATFGGEQGFEVMVTFENIEGLRFKQTIRGAVSDDKLLALRFTAPERYYFQKDLPDFEAMASSVAFPLPLSHSP
jgi:hypothetical protein